MSNRTLGTVTVDAGDTAYKLQYSINALCTLEDELGSADLVDLQTLLATKQSLGMMRTMFWIGLQQHHPGVTKAQAGDIMDAVGLVRAGEALAQAVTSAFGTPAGGAAPLAKRPGASVAAGG